MDLFRAVLRSEEKSIRVLKLIEEILDLNAANYTVWQYRRRVLFDLNLDLNEELDFMDTFAEENPKNYQIWYHRRAIVEKLNDSSRELAFTAKVFSVDAKNYHAWSHR
jgi:protein farnesyltransferase/geranylgeranyltransferase type-1 subunit alpha